MNLGQNMKRIRKEKKITLMELSKKTGFSAGYISQIENGKRDKPSREFLEGIAYGLDVSDTYLTTGRKTLADLSDEEIKADWKNAQSNFNKRRKEYREEIDKDLSEILNMELGFTEETYLSHAIKFLKESTGNDLLVLTAILQQYNNYKDIYHITNDKAPLLEEIQDIQQQIEAVFLTRFGIEQYKEKSD